MNNNTDQIIIIAEIGQNHNGNMNLAKEMIWEAKNNGADIAKFQLFDAKHLFSKDGNPWYDYNCKTELTRSQVELLYLECCKAEIEFMASVFDVERLQWLEQIGVNRHKIASRSINDKLLIDAICKTSKEIIVSLGMWDGSQFPLFETENSVKYLYCISKYPTPLNEIKLKSIDFNKYNGISDHSVGITVVQASLARGARIIEKHFTKNKEMYGPDHSLSMNYDDLKQLCIFRKELMLCLD